MNCRAVKLIVATTALAALPLLASALTLTEMSGSIDACHQPNADVADTLAALASEGWVSLPEGDVPADIIERLIWPQAASYTTGDSGGAGIAEVIEIQRKAVAGLSRKQDTRNSMTRILKRQIGADTEAALVLWLQPNTTTTSITCRFALSSASLVGHTGDDFSVPQVVETTPGQSFNVTTLNAASLSAKIGAPVAVSGVLETLNSFPTEASQ